VVAHLDADYIAKMEDVLEGYEWPHDPKQPVICLGEKPVTLHADVRPTSPAAPGREARRDNEHERCGTANVFCATAAHARRCRSRRQKDPGTGPGGQDRAAHPRLPRRFAALWQGKASGSEKRRAGRVAFAHTAVSSEASALSPNDVEAG
jgi:hypothetical protein